MKKVKNLVSVIIPTYNGERTIARAIKSVLVQDVDIEILVCDDCSTDKTIKIAEKYKFVKIFKNRKHTGGPNAGRNLGLKKASGEYIAFLDQDDEWFPFKLKDQLEKVKEGYDVVSSSKIDIHE